MPIRLMSSCRPAMRRARGFTLIEVMVVVVIIAILGALVGPRLLGRTDEARVVAARQHIATNMQALKLYRLDNHRYPTTEQALRPQIERTTAGSAAPGSKDGGYLDR